MVGVVGVHPTMDESVADGVREGKVDIEACGLVEGFGLGKVEVVEDGAA